MPSCAALQHDPAGGWIAVRSCKKVLIGAENAIDYLFNNS